MNPTQDHTMPDNLDACTTIGRDQADILRGSTKIVRRDTGAPGPADTTLIQAARVPAARLASMVTTIRMRTRRGARFVAWLKAWAWIFAGAALFTFLGYLSAIA